MKNFSYHNLTYILLLVMLTGFFSSCKKEDEQIKESSSLTIVNAISGGGTLVANFNANNKLQYYKTAQQIPAYNSATPFFQFQGYTGSFPISIYQFTDTLNSVYSGRINITPGGIHSLFLTGTSAAVDTIFTRDKIPLLVAADSLIGVRFVNASKGSMPLSINLGNQISIPIEASLPYKGVSAFKTYSLKKSVTGYNFEVREASTSKLIATYTLNSLTTLPNRNFTLVLRGFPGGTGANAQSVFMVKNY
ncbi:hypothetical protein [Pedobacter mucosus]|uniref:hypothetical protein n=1 Tax=Pedobacter mucosus TaxID=2895286 RepID=UPI001EE3AAA0|nr:hypothetical protein [Pedobacter mucosus]UKT64979.1 hypothetical protein LOK61_04195 [Pedobacter mucosus]